nr:uncharacterized protein LOC117274047 [Nicotiana tomentosiformis]
MRKSQDSSKLVDKLRREVTKIAAAGDLPFDLLMETNPSVPAGLAASVAPASQSKEPDLAAHTTEAVLQMFTNPATPRAEDDEIQLEEPEGGDAATDTETT